LEHGEILSEKDTNFSDKAHPQKEAEVMSWQRFVAAFDPHGDKQDPKAVRALLDFCKIWKPTIRIHGGDNWDFRPLRRKACEDERRESMATDFRAGVKFITQFQPTHFVRGNHDERLWELAQAGHGVESDYAIHAIAEVESLVAKMKCQMLPYHKRLGVLRFGHMKVLHGFHCGIYAARQTALVYGSALFGHTHVIDQHAVPGLERRAARNCGCLCQLDMDYNSRQPNTLRQAHGFAYGVVNSRTGDFNVWQAEPIGGEWILPTDTVTL
jgi:hypothetical protein